MTPSNDDLTRPPTQAGLAASGQAAGFALALRMWRQRSGLSLSAAARLAGITKAHLHDLEHGRSSNPCISTLVGLARAYDTLLPFMAELAAWGFSVTDLGRAALRKGGET